MLTLAGLKNIVRHTEDLVIKMFILNRRSTVSFCFFPEDLFFAFLLVDIDEFGENLYASRHSLITGSSI